MSNTSWSELIFNFAPIDILLECLTTELTSSKIPLVTLLKNKFNLEDSKKINTYLRELREIDLDKAGKVFDLIYKFCLSTGDENSQLLTDLVKTLKTRHKNPSVFLESIFQDRREIRGADIAEIIRRRHQENRPANSRSA
tara:strand:+ start:859 stop:1278 length:420 start_codon:yes stop_codon:yes gene_type:complete